jgi:glycerol-3-phosphate acyltransferase PlsY
MALQDLTPQLRTRLNRMERAVGWFVLLAAVLLIAPLFHGPVEWMQLIAGLGAIVGHTFSVYLHFRGGKAVATSLGVMLSLVWLPATIALGVFIIVVAIWRYISLGSISAALALAVAQCLVGNRPFVDKLPQTVFCLLIAALVIARHRSNIRRLLAGTESYFDIRKRNKTLKRK